ncbi:amino acid adenylation domain-containing protein [Phytohabitans kaempferiae]|uniref:Amino acid adenylation domain-containing protein n=1 Tax=Phytohabitans kaempferiae TaxID=1620943 RepID=A0ABV6M1D1_9ACTN
MSGGGVRTTERADALREELIRARLAGGGGRTEQRLRLEPVDRTGPLPLSYGQQQMWFLSRLEPDSWEYVVPVALRLRGRLDVDALRGAFGGVVARHEILRTRYALAGKEPVQVIDPPAPFALPVEDLAALPTVERERRAAELAASAPGEPFDLAEEHPVRARLLRLAADDHILVVVFHHVACDAWSVRVFAEELGAGYRAALDGTDAALAPLPVQFADYAAWERAHLTGSVLQRHLDHWRGQLEGVPPLELPTDRPRPPTRSWEGDAVPFAFPAALTERLRKVSAEHDTTLFMTLLAAYQTLLGRYTGRTDVPVGTVVSGRTRPEVQRLIGYGINSLVMRGRGEGDPTFAELLGRTRATVLAAFDHQEVPFARLVDELQPQRDMSRTPLFQAAFTMHEERAAGFDLPGLAVEALTAPSRVARFDVTLQVEEAADGTLRGNLEYVKALFDRSTVERMTWHLMRLLDRATAEPDVPMSHHVMLDAGELAIVAPPIQLLTPPDVCVHEAFERRAATCPDSVAVVFGDESLTYAELNARANRLAHHLRDLGAGPETLVGVSLERGIDLVPTLLGVLKSGAAYLPLDPAYPADRLAFMLSDTAAPVVVTTAAHVEKLSAIHSGRFVVLDGETDAAVLAERPVTDPVPVSTPDNLIYVIYTSGSTGRPKGVCLTHANVLRLLTTAEEHYAFGETDVWPLFHSYAFDVSVWELWGSLLYGGKLVVVPQAVTRSPEDFLDLLVAHRVTVLNQTPSAFRGLVALAGEGDRRIDALALRAVVFAGEKLEVQELAPWVARRGLDRTLLLNMYGITETTVHTTYYRLVAADLVPGAPNPVGHPLRDIQVYLLDADGNVAPIGVPGEIHVGGPGVARGYLHRPELTAERFVPDPFGPPGARLYKSGDLARREPDGSLSFLGRIDHQVKIRGFRIELGEIETAIAAHPQVRDAVVVVREDKPGDKRLVGYCVPARDAVPSPGELRALLARTLPEYMIPSAFVPLGKIPLTANGKLDRAALPSVDRTALSADRAYVAPRTPEEERVAAVWREVIGVDRVGVDDGFFDLGGDSIRAVALVGALREAGYDVAVRDVFAHRTVARLTAFLGQSGPVAATAPAEGVRPFALVSAADRAALPEGVVDAYPLAQVQLGMVVEMLADDGRHHYHNSTSFRIVDSEPFALPAFVRATQLVVDRHEVLRTSFALDAYSTPLQLVHGVAKPAVGARDLAGLAGEELERSLRAFMAAERAQLFDLAQPPLVRFHAHTTGDGWWLTLTECHAVLEGWSHHSLLMELVGAYRAYRDGREPEPAVPAAVRYADFVAAELSALDDPADRAHWQGTVERYAKFTLPAGWGDDPSTPRGVHKAWVPYRDLEERLRALASTVEVPIKAVLHAAHLKVMSQLTDEPAFHTGLVTNARPEATGADRVAGVYLNPLPFGFDRGARTWRELVRGVFAREIEVWPHRRFPLAAMQREFGGGERLVDVRFSYQDFRQVDADVVDYAATIDDSPTEFPLGVSTRAGFCVLTANNHFLSRSNVDRVAAMYRAVLEAMAADPEGDAAATYLPEGELRRVVRDWNDSAATFAEASVLELFERQAAVTPAATAVRCGTAELTYEQLDARANRYAHHLRELGVGPESLVGILLERGLDLPAALLGVWKAGGAYVPLDPAFPADRIGAMMADAGARAVITQEAYADRFTGDVMVVDRDRRLIARAPSTAPDRADDPDRLAYAIFTSGSTGRPKGVAVTHRGLANHVQWAAEVLASRGTGGAPLFSSVAFDLVVPNLWAPLVSGQRLWMLPPEAELDALSRELADAAPFSFIKLTPGHLEILEPSAGYAPVIVVAGEALPGPVAEKWRQVLGDGNLINEYGPTEASVGTCIFPVSGPQGVEVVPIGRPLPNMTMRVLDANLRPVPVGVVGELYVGGTGVARGYVNRPELTAEKFLPDPWSPGARMYRTGDLVRWSVDGNIEFLGRIDDQVKIRGYRVELGEIRAVLLDHPGVRDAAVVVHEDRIVAYVVGSTEVKDHCGRTLPEYMVPSVFVAVERIPLNANGKVDRRALPDPDGLADERAYVAPRNPVEERIAALWCEVLGAERVSVEDSFFDIGGHSIRAIALVGALRAAGFDAGVRDVFTHRTVAALAAALPSAEGTADEEPVKPFALIDAADRAALPGGLVDAYPLAQVQLGMLVEMLADDSVNKYHNTTTFRIRDGRPFDVEALRAAAAAVVARHEMLRTSFDLDGLSVPMQLVHGTATIPIEVRDLRGLDADGLRQAIRDFTARERATLFDLTRAPLLRVAAHVESDEAWWMSVSVCHPITEGWSHRSLLMELVEAYLGVRGGGVPPERAVPALRYADFVAAEIAAVESTEDRSYWQGIVDRYARFHLPAGWGDDGDTPRRAYTVNVPLADLGDALRARASEAGASLKAVLHAAHLKVMSQLTDEPAFYTGLVSSGRPEVAGAERVYGMYLNTLPFAYDGTAATWREAVRQAYDREGELWPHRRFPMPVIQRDLGDGARLLDVRFSYLDLQQAQAETDVVDAESGVGEGATEFGLAVAARGSGLVLTVDTHTLSPTNAERIGRMYRAVLEAIAADLDGDARETYLPAGERDHLLMEWSHNPGATVFRSVLEMVEERAATSPGALAVEVGTTRVTYADLDARANRLAHHLRERGVGPESLVAVLLDRVPDLVVSLLAVWKAGGAYVPLDPAFPAERIDRMLADAGVRVAVTQAAYTDRFAVETVLPDASDQPATAPERVDDLDRLAYVIFTSGSTGRPKGVAVTHRGLANHVQWAAEVLASRGTGGAPLFSSVAFDLVVPNLWAPLVSGQRLWMLSPSAELDALSQELADAAPFSFIKLTPGHLEILEPSPDYAPVIVVAGEALPGPVADKWRQVLGDGNLINEYGPTEASVGTCIFPVSGPQGVEVVPIGRPLPNMTMFVLDANLRPVPAGVVGELYVGGTGVARGYVNRPELTAEKFLPDPFGSVGGRLYRTGDLVRWSTEGAIEFLGRIDDQVKIRGYRVELGEIRAVLLDHPGVRDAAVVVHEDRIVAYVVGSTEVKDHCGRTLPEYMVPATVIAVERIPLNANGKVDRRALPDPDGLADERAYVAPRTASEERIAAIWCEVLGAERVSVEDSFFDIGGHSIRAIALVGALRAAGFDAGVRDVFTHRTVAALAAALPGADGPAAEPAGVAPFALVSADVRERLPENVADAYPLSQVQLGMLVEMLADERAARYHNSATFLIRDGRPFDAAALRAAARTVVARHEMLRTSFDLDRYGVPLQLVHPEGVELPVTVHDLRGLDAEGVEAAVREHIARERANLFDLSRPPLLRISALVESDEAWRLGFTHCHAITEGWSQHSLLMEVLDLYRRFAEGGEPAAYEAPAVRYADFIAAELASLESAEDQGYWQNVVDRFAPCVLPPDWGDGPEAPRQDLKLPIVFRDIEEPLRALAADTGTSFKAVLLAAHMKVLSTVINEPAFHTGVLYSARPEAPGAERVYGMYLNTLPFAHDTAVAKSWRDLVRQVFDREAEVYAHRRYPLPAIQRQAGGHRLFDIMFRYQDFHQVDTGRVDVRGGAGEGTNEFTLTIATQPGHLVLRAISTGLNRAAAERLAGMYRAVLEAMAADPDGDARATYLSEHEKAQVLEDWNDTEVEW